MVLVCEATHGLAVRNNLFIMNIEIKNLDQMLSQLDRRLQLQNHQESEKHLTTLIDYTENNDHDGFECMGGSHVEQVD